MRGSVRSRALDERKGEYEEEVQLVVVNTARNQDAP